MPEYSEGGTPRGHVSVVVTVTVAVVMDLAEPSVVDVLVAVVVDMRFDDYEVVEVIVVVDATDDTAGVAEACVDNVLVTVEV